MMLINSVLIRPIKSQLLRCGLEAAYYMANCPLNFDLHVELELFVKRDAGYVEFWHK